jgi:xanthine dehydrogenase accessory factor
MILIRGGGDLASGVALRLYKAGMRVVITELPQPLAVRRLVSFAEAIYVKETEVEGIIARRVSDSSDSLSILQVISKGKIPVIIDPEANSARSLYPIVIIDARMRKLPPEPLKHNARIFIGLGPGFEAGRNCHAVIETNRGHRLGRVIWEGSPQEDTGIPEDIGSQGEDRVLRAPVAGNLITFANLCDKIDAGQIIAEVNGIPVVATFDGVLRGLLHDNFPVTLNLKIGDLDPRGDPQYCSLVSDKSLAVGGGVLEAILSKLEIRNQLWR